LEGSVRMLVSLASNDMGHLKIRSRRNYVLYGLFVKSKMGDIGKFRLT
jgi:hypothetical protein